MVPPHVTVRFGEQVAGAGGRSGLPAPPGRYEARSEPPVGAAYLPPFGCPGLRNDMTAVGFPERVPFHTLEYWAM